VDRKFAEARAANQDTAALPQREERSSTNVQPDDGHIEERTRAMTTPWNGPDAPDGSELRDAHVPSR
jgi:hypothetical protein